MIEQPARRGHHHVDTATQRLLLRFVPHTAVDRDAVHRGVLGVLLHALLHLQAEFTRGGEHEHAGAARPPQQAVHHGQCEAGRLARARLGEADQVAALEGERNGFALNGGGAFVPGIVQGVQQGLGQPEVGEGHIADERIRIDDCHV